MVRDFQEQAIRSLYGHLQVARVGFFQSGSADPFKYLVLEPFMTSGPIARLDGLLYAAPRLNLTGLLAKGDVTAGFSGVGVDPRLEPGGTTALRIIAGQRLAAEHPEGILVGQGLARAMKVQLGDHLTVLVNVPGGAITGMDVRVRGVFATVSKDYDDSAIRLPIAAAQELLRTQGVHLWVLMLDETGRTDAVAAELRERLAPEGFEVAPWHRLAQFYVRAAALLADQVGIVRLIIAVIVVLGILNAMTISVIERTGEIGTSLALGVRRTAVMRQFLLEGLLVGAVGIVLGSLLALGVAGAVELLGIPMPPAPGMAEGFEARIDISPGLIAETAVTTLVAASLAALYPAWRASRMNIVAALRRSR
jgi:putative ABC transport system permease protein